MQTSLQAEGRGFEPLNSHTLNQALMRQCVGAFLFARQQYLQQRGNNAWEPYFTAYHYQHVEDLINIARLGLLSSPNLWNLSP